MPYIPEQRERDVLDPHIDALLELLKHRTGAELNYILSRLAGGFTVGRRAFGISHSSKIGYVTRAEAFGHVQAFAREFERRVLDVYEIPKQFKNGDLPEYAELDRRS